MFIPFPLNYQFIIKLLFLTLPIFVLIGDVSNSGYILIKESLIYKQQGTYLGWPTILKQKKRDLIVVFSGGRVAHIGPFGKIQMIRSEDNGMTWTKPITIINTLLDDRDAGILETSSGTLLINWFTSIAFDTPQLLKKHPSWVRQAKEANQKIRDNWLGNWMLRSTDNGYSWSKPIKMHFSSPHGPIELSSGELLHIGNGFYKGEKILGVEKSFDDGQSWQFITKINLSTKESIKHYWEPHSVQLKNGKIIALFRYEPKDFEKSYIHQSESFDNGRTWSIPVKTNMLGFPPHIIKLKNNWLLTSYGYRKKPFSERAMLSKDDGKTWDVKNELILRYAINHDLGYPSTIQLDDGSLFTVYYQVDKKGEKTSLMSTHWRLN